MEHFKCSKLRTIVSNVQTKSFEHKIRLDLSVWNSAWSTSQWLNILYNKPFSFRPIVPIPVWSHLELFSLVSSGTYLSLSISLLLQTSKIALRFSYSFVAVYRELSPGSHVRGLVFYFPRARRWGGGASSFLIVAGEALLKESSSTLSNGCTLSRAPTLGWI